MPLLGSLFENHGSYAGLSVAMVSVPPVTVFRSVGVHPARLTAPDPDEAAADEAGAEDAADETGAEAAADEATEAGALLMTAAVGAELAAAGAEAAAAELAADEGELLDDDPQADAVRAVAAARATTRVRGRRTDIGDST